MLLHMRPSIKINAPAKLNLALAVGPRNQSGRHPICSWMVTVDLFDELLVTRLEGDRLSRYAILWHKDAKRRSDINWSITKDLAVKAHQALEAHTGLHLPVQMKLEKRIPVGGGLGGGSSDAAAMLRAVNSLFELGLPIEELANIGAAVGSDVPFLVRGGGATVEGLGERVEHHEPPSLHAVIAFPNSICATAGVYGAFDEIHSDAPSQSLREEEISGLIRAGQSGTLKSESLFNDLAAAAMRIAPQVADDLASLAELAERPAHVTGSGSSIFVLCDDALHAAALAETVERQLSLPAVAVRTCAIEHAVCV